jgi:hypothetical protein
MNRLRIVALDDTVVFPGMPVTLPTDSAPTIKCFWYQDATAVEDRTEG